jgi:hypothetical protein
MICHDAESFSALSSCQKRAAHFAQDGDIDPSHPRDAAWSNAKMMIDADDDPLGDLLYLDWFAVRLDAYAKSHMLAGDPSIAAMLHEWQERMMIDATKPS